MCDEHGILLIFDEVQSGMGRCGDWFAARHYGVTPDILLAAKGIASGFPLSAVVARSDLMGLWPTWAHGTTFGGNPVSMAAASAVLDVLEREQLPARFERWLASEARPLSPTWLVVDLDDTKSSGGATFTRQGDGSYLASGKNAVHDTYTLTVTSQRAGM